MVSPNRTPEAGVGIYSRDPTQGPACAVACGAGTIYRNYFAPVNGQVGQSKNNQIDCISDLGKAWDNSSKSSLANEKWLCFASHQGLTTISQRLQTASEEERDKFRQLLRIGHPVADTGNTTRLPASGIANLLFGFTRGVFSRSHLKKLDFTQVLYNWDCG